MIVDEAHRSHYELLDGYARHLRDALPHATMIAFTGTPIAEADRDTRQVFGDDIDIYDLTRAVTDGATVRVYHESRLIQVDLPSDIRPESIDDRVDQVTAGLDDAERSRIERSVAVMNAVYGAPDRLKKLAADLVEHWEDRSAEMRKFLDGPGKGMVVAATRGIAARLYEEIVALRPGWHHDADDNESAVTEMGEGVLADIARDLVRSVQGSFTVDWAAREDVRAKLRSTIKRLLAKHKYPPDAEPEAIRLVLQQMETYAEVWTPDVRH